MAGKGINIPLVADVTGFVKGTQDVEARLQSVDGSLDELAQGGDAAAEKLETSFRDAFDSVRADADKTRGDVGDSIGRVGEEGKPRAAEAGSEIGSELAANIGEQIGSGQANIADVVAGTLGGLVSVPGLGAAAAGIGIAGLLVKGVLDGFSRRKAEMQQRIQATFDAMDVDPTGAIKLDKLQVVDQAIQDHFDSVAEGWEKINQAALDPMLVQRAITGDLTPSDLTALDAAIDAHTTVTERNTHGLRDQNVQLDEQGQTLQWLREQNEKQAESNRQSAVAKQEESRVTQGLTEATEDNTDATRDNTSKVRENAQAHLDARQKARDYQQALDDVTAAVEKNGRTLDIHSQKGRDNQQVLDNLAEAALADGKVRKDEIKDLEDAAKAMGVKASAADDLAKKLLGIPKEIKTKVTLDINSEETQRQLQRIGFRWDQP